MSRRVSLPAADDLFRANRRRVTEPSRDEPRRAGPPRASRRAPAPRKPSGRVRHDEKMTVYVTADELLDIEHARLSLRRHQGLAVDRGRLVREAIAMALADLEANGDDSVLVQRLIGSMTRSRGRARAGGRGSDGDRAPSAALRRAPGRTSRVPSTCC